ncbi:MAG: hypothetical protein SNH27_14470 [Rikenellaceae bacterium]
MIDKYWAENGKHNYENCKTVLDIPIEMMYACKSFDSFMLEISQERMLTLQDVELYL